MASPSPTRAELRTQLQNAFNIVHETRKFALDNADNFIGLVDTYVQSLETEFAGGAIAAADALRSALASMMSGAVISPILSAWGKLIDVPERDTLSILGRMYEDFIDEPETIKSRGFTFGSPVADGGNVGNGTIVRLNKDENDLDIENQTPDLKTAECIQDANSGSTKNREILEFRGGFGGLDLLDVEGVGATRTITAVDARDGSILLNPGFDEITGTAASPDDIPNWDVLDFSNVALTVDSTNFNLDATNIYLPAPDDNTTVHGLNVKIAQARLRQRMVNIGTDLDPLTPYYLSVAFNRQVGSWTGNLTIKLGSQTVVTALAAQTGWNTVAIGPGDENWFKIFNQENLAVEIDVDRSGGTALLLDDITLTPFENFDGGWYVVPPGQTPFLKRDEFTWTDTATESIIQRLLWLLFGVYLPHTTGTPTITDP